MGRECLSSYEDAQMRRIPFDELASRTEDKYLNMHPQSKRNIRQEVLDYLNGKEKLPDDLVSLIKSAKSDFLLKNSNLLAPQKAPNTLGVDIGAEDPVRYLTKRQPYPSRRRENYEL